MLPQYNGQATGNSPPFPNISHKWLAPKKAERSAPKNCIKKRRRSNVVEKFRAVSNSVWVCFEAVIIEKTLKEEWTNKTNFDDNYN